MAEKRIQFSNVVQNQLPAYVRNEYPLISEFLKEYYVAQEFESGPIDLIQNIDQYIKIDEITNLTETVGLRTDITYDASTIDVDMISHPEGTTGFPDSYGLLKIDDEIITYTSKTKTSFNGCIRGFSGITSYRAETETDQLVFNSTESADHAYTAPVQNLSCLFLKEFLLKTKYQLLPGLEERDLHEDLNKNVFIKQAKDFYLSKGTDHSFEILFKALYNEDVSIIKPRDFLVTPSNAHFIITKDLVVEPIEGDPANLLNATLYQDAYGDSIEKGYAPITSIEKINPGYGKTYYKLSIDGGYNRDSRVDGALYGSFTVHPKTKVIGEVSAGTTSLDVDSTVGFSTSGELLVDYVDTTIGVVSYTSKNLTQFFGCSGIDKRVLNAANVGINTYAYGYNFYDQDDKITVRINSVLGDLDYPTRTHYYNINDTAKIKTLGVANKNFRAQNWFYNIAPTFNVTKITLVNASDRSYQVNTNTEHTCRIGDSVTLIGSSVGTYASSLIIEILDAKSFVIRGQGDIDTADKYTIKRNILKTNSNTFPEAVQYTTNVQNVYNINGQEDLLIASSSIPSYYAQPLNASTQETTITGTFSGTEFEISPDKDHGFYTGDEVYYIPEKIEEKYFTAGGAIATRVSIGTKLFDEGLYFLYRVNSSTVKFAKSRTDISNGSFVSIEATEVKNNKVQPFDFKGKTLASQKLVREVLPPKNDGILSPTIPGYTGILINGVEILNYKSPDLIHYGRIEDIEVIAPGDDYDVINPPLIKISDPVGAAATGHVDVSGSLEEIRVLDSGFDYQGIPEVNIRGGNGSGANATVTMRSIVHKVDFDAQVVGGAVGVGTTLSTIGFGTYHKFKNAEQVIYLSNGQEGISGLTTDASYFVNTISNTEISLHPTENDAQLGISTVSLLSYGVGRQSIKSYNTKSVVDAVNVVSAGSGYSYKKREVSSAGVSTALNKIEFINHGYESGEVINYSSTGTAIGGLNSGTDYYLTKVDDNNFKLSAVGLGSTNKDFYYRTNQYIDLTSVGDGTFKYPDISVTLVGRVGISSIGSETFEAEVQPIFRGGITGASLTNKGVGYGSSEIINYIRDPLVTLSFGDEAQLTPIIVDGKIDEVIVMSAGKEYNSPPDLVVEGNGIGAVVVPVVSNGIITSVKVVAGGAGYTQDTTTISVLFPGDGAVLKPNVQTWRIDLVKRHFEEFSEDDGFISEGINDKYELEYCHLYAPRKLRESVYSVDQTGKIIYGENDLVRQDGVEVAARNHSPIIGWAYDGNPIYGPFGYQTKQGGVVAQMRSGYKLSLAADRPPFPAGFFVEDYSYSLITDEDVLDENNGRFGITPEFPEGTYAYFATIDSTQAASAGAFANYKQPVFPYLIGQSYHSTPNNFNFRTTSNQDEFVFSREWLRNTQPYNLMDGEVQYEYVYIPNKLKQTAKIKNVESGKVDTVGIETGGTNYKVGDPIAFINPPHASNGAGAAANVSSIGGKVINTISIASSTINPVEIYPGENRGDYVVVCDNPHNFRNNETISISGLSTTSSKIGGFYKAGITTAMFSVAGVGTTTTGIGTIGATGIVTYINLDGNLSYPTEDYYQVKNIRSNDVFKLNDEKVKILNVEPKLSRVRVIRGIGTGSTVGAAHSATTVLYEDSRLITIDSGFSTSYKYTINKEIYFNPSESVGLGTTAGVGIGTTISFANPGTGISNIFIPTKSIYIPKHELKTGDKLTYSPNSGAGLIVQFTSAGIGTTVADQTSLYVAKISDDLIGLSTVRVGLGSTGSFVGISSTYQNSTTLYFTGIGTGVYHSFKTNYDVITGEISRNLVTVATASTHGLTTDDEVKVSVSPGVTTSVVVKYNDYNRRLLVNPKTFVAGGVDTTFNTITIADHGYSTGQKIVHNASTPSGGLSDNGIYFIVRVDNNKFKLSNTYYDGTLEKPIIVNITSASGGTISLVNPPLKVYKDSTVNFDVSDGSLAYTVQGTAYPAFEFNFYTDQACREIWSATGTTKNFEVQRTGTVGTAGAKVALTVDKNIPEVLYYKLVPVFESDLPAVKSEVVIDSDVISSNLVEVKESLYNGTYEVSLPTTSSFTYSISSKPEKVSYAGTSSLLNYETTSKSALGSISKFELMDGGQYYYDVPGISTVTSNLGQGAIVSASSTTIGRVIKTEIENIGYNFPSDPTLSPSVGLPQVVQIESLATFESIGVNSVGRGYSSAPKLLVFDGKTQKQVSEVDLKYTLGKSEVEIRKNVYGLSDTRPTIIPIHNSGGVGINTVDYNSSTQTVTLTLDVGFSTANSFPFSVGDKILVENISVGLGSTGSNFNSEGYDYKLFTVSATDENLGGIGTIAYSLSGILPAGQIPGTYDPLNSSGRVIPEKYFPVFDIKLKTKDYFPGETVTSSSATGTVESWDKNIGILKISSGDNFVVNETITGKTSNTQGVASSITAYDSTFTLAEFSEVIHGWETDSGVLNKSLQRIEDSLYYQKFSYSLKSKVDFDTWDDVVSATNHTSGFQKFCDYQLESTSNDPTMVIGLSTDTTAIDSVNELSGIGNLHCVEDFDLVKENSLTLGKDIVSNKIIFANRVLTDYYESVGNRVLSIDDMSNTFNSNPRATQYSAVATIDLAKVRAAKFFTFVKDKRYVGQRQLMVVDLIHDGSQAYLNQYGRIETQYIQGSFDFSVSGDDGQLLFYPVNYSVNDYNIGAIAYNLDDNLLGIGSTSLGSNNVWINSNSVKVLKSNTSTNIVSIGRTYQSAKILVEITADVSGNSNEFEFEEINLIHDSQANGLGTVDIIDYGQMETTTSNVPGQPGLGTYSAYIDGENIKLDFFPNSVGIATTAVVNTLAVAMGGFTTTTTGVGTIHMKHAQLEGKSTYIAGTGAGYGATTVVAKYPTQTGIIDEFDAAYFIVQVSDLSTNAYEMAEMLVVDDYSEETASGNTYEVEYGNLGIGTNSGYVGLGSFGTRLDINAGSTTYVELTFTPTDALSNLNMEVNVYMNAIKINDDSADIIDFNNGSIETSFGEYEGTERDIKRTFNLTHKNDPIFEKYFFGNSAEIVKLTDNTITLPNHFFVSGETIKYHHAGAGSTQAIGCQSTAFVGAGTTDKLPGENLYVVKIDDDSIKIATSAEKALKAVPETVDLTSVGIGTSHRFVSTNQNAKVLIGLDNIIQGPVVATAQTTHLADQALSTVDVIYFSGITSFFGSDLIRIGEEIMKVEGVGIGSTNGIRVRRNWLGTKASGYGTDALVTKVEGNYNIVDNLLTFAEAPYGNTPLSTSTNPPDDRDWVGIATGSSFQGRTFLRSGITNSSNETYYENFIFDDISHGFTGITKEFTLKSSGNNVTGISSEAIILINDVFQARGNTADYTLEDNAGITSISFTGTAQDISNDVGISSFPKGGIIISVGSTEGMGYQPLVAAGATYTVGAGGSISAISIGNSGSGYRIGVQTVSVGIQTQGVDGTYVTGIATAIIANGHITGIGTINPISFTGSTIKKVVFDDPLSYTDIPLNYSSDSVSGVGSNARVSVVVSQGSSVIDFNISNQGYGYGVKEILTLPIGGPTGIPTFTTGTFKEFQLTVDEKFNDEFTGWSVGQLQFLDDWDKEFDSDTRAFQLKEGGSLVSIIAGKGSKVDVQSVILIFINDILQVPGKGYTFTGGSQVNFTEAPKPGDTSKVVFYKGTGGVDVAFRNVLETVKKGDDLTITYDASLGQPAYWEEDTRTVSNIDSTDIVSTNPYFGPGNTNDESLLRPVAWCRQTEDKIINEIPVGKDRELYEPNIYPNTYIIKSVGIGSTTVWVDNLRPQFDSQNESDTDLEFQKKVTFVSQGVKTGAAATAIVSAAGTISSIDITDGGVGYTTAFVSIASTVGVGTTTNAFGSVTIGAAGTITGVAITNPGYGYTWTDVPSVLISPPTSVDEQNTVVSYAGDSGVIVGFGTTTVSGSKELIFDLYIPGDSDLRSTTFVSAAVTASALAKYDYFRVTDSNVGLGSTTVYSQDLSGNTVGVGTSFADNVYVVKSSQLVQRNVAGVTTYIRQVNVKVNGFKYAYSGVTTSDYFGSYSWGRIQLGGRVGVTSYQAYTQTGITTSMLVIRTEPLKYKNYIA
jgi:hypothetical protein